MTHRPAASYVAPVIAVSDLGSSCDSHRDKLGVTGAATPDGWPSPPQPRTTSAETRP